MAITRQKKEEIAQKLQDIFSNVNPFVFISFSGLSVEEIAEIRNTLRDAGVSYFVTKKTLIKRALENASYTGDTPELPGEIALVYPTEGGSPEEELAAAREIYEFQNKHKDKITIVGGVFDSSFKDKEEMTEIAAIPGVEVLYGKFVNVINSPIQGFVGVLDQIAQSKS